MRCDVLVAGGGSAGMAAAVAAARGGARTVLIERQGALGGMVAGSLIHSICGLYLLRAEAGVELANGGFAAEFAGRLTAAGGASGPFRMGRVDVLLQQPAAFAWLADRVIEETPNLEVRFHTEMIAAQAGSGGVAAEICCRGEREIVEARTAVDATGDGVLAKLAGAACEQESGSKLQRPAIIFVLQGVGEGALSETARLRLALLLAEGVRAGGLAAGALGAGFRASGRAGEVFVTLDLEGAPGMGYDPNDARCLSALERHGRKLAGELALFLKGKGEGFERSYVGSMPGRIGIRESRRVAGEYRMEAGDLLSGARFSDAVALAAWPMEMRERATGPRFRFPEADRPCEIPLRALRARGFSNLFAAGRCISSSHEAQASLRVIGTCLATGEAAGLAAAMASGMRGEAEGAALELMAGRVRERVMARGANGGEPK